VTPASLLAELRRRIERIEARPPAPVPRLPPSPWLTGRAPRAARLDDLPGAERQEDGTLVVRSTLGPEERVGRVSPAEVVVAHPDVVAPLCGLTSPVRRDLLHGMRLLDVETTGLAGGTGTLAFLIGVGRFEGDGTLVVEQLVLSAPAEEPRLLDRLAGLLAGGTLLVTYNGRSFDAPLLRTRTVLCRRPPGALATLPHFDLLPLARRLWRSRAGDCRLVTLEDRILGSRRDEDLPGAFAPAAYATFLRSGDAGLLGRIIRHNADDIFGMAALLAAALRLLEEPSLWGEDASEVLAVGEHRLAMGDDEGALPLLERGADLARAPEIRRRALTQLALAHRRAGRLEKARSAWERYRALFPSENRGFIEVAKLLEHAERDPASALAVAASAPHLACHEVQKRLDRLRRRVGG